MKLKLFMTLCMIVLAFSTPRYLSQLQEESQESEKSSIIDGILKKGILSSLLNSQTNNKFQLTRDSPNDSKQLQELEKQGELLSALGKLGDLPYQALLPRRKATPSKHSQNTQPNLSAAMLALNALMSSRKDEKNPDQLDWQNPDFTSEGNMMAFSKIFGDRGRRQASGDVSEATIQTLLIREMPFLKGGQIIEMSTSPFKKGVYVNVEFRDANDDIYTIKAKYKSHRNKLEILSLSESENPFREESSDSQDEEVQEFQQKLQEQEQQLKEKEELEMAQELIHRMQRQQIQISDFINENELNVEEKQPNSPQVIKKSQQKIQETNDNKIEQSQPVSTEEIPNPQIEEQQNVEEKNIKEQETDIAEEAQQWPEEVSQNGKEQTNDLEEFKEVGKMMEGQAMQEENNVEEDLGEKEEKKEKLEKEEKEEKEENIVKN